MYYPFAIQISQLFRKELKTLFTAYKQTKTSKLHHLKTVMLVFFTLFYHIKSGGIKLEQFYVEISFK